MGNDKELRHNASWEVELVKVLYKDVIDQQVFLLQM